MTTPPRMLLFFSLAMCLLSPGAMAAPGDELLTGTWRVNLARSTYPMPPDFTRMVCTIEPWEDGLRVIYDIVRPRGGVTHLEWTGKVDGRDYAVQGVDLVLTNAYKRAGERAFAVLQKVDGKTAALSMLVISGDGKTITTTTPIKNARGEAVDNTVTVYEKQ